MHNAERGVRTLLVRIVRVPDDWPAAKRRRAQAVLGLATAMLVAAVPTAIAVAFLLPQPWVNVLLIGLGVPVHLAIRALVHRGLVTPAGWLLFGYFLVAPVVGSVTLGETRASVFFLVVGVVLAGAVLPPRGLLLAVGLSVAVLLLLPAFVTPPESYSPEEVTSYLAISLALVGCATVVGAFGADLGYRSADRSRRQVERLAEELRTTNAELEARVRRRTDELSAALERERRLSESLAELSVRDPLTGLHNRRHLDDELIRMVAYSRRSGAPLSVAVIDLDDFKSVNDHFTHLVGDDVLRTAAQLLASGTRTADVLVRTGGEEFALLMPGTDAEDAARVCERMRQDLAEHDWDEVQPRLQVTASFGVATTAGDTDPSDLLRVADTRLFEAKRQGKNRIVQSSAA